MGRCNYKLLLVLMCMACTTTTTLESSWREPAAAPFAFHRLLVAFVSTDVGQRNEMEDKLAEHIPNSFPAYRSVPELSRSDSALAKQQLRNKLYDGALVMRVVNVENTQSYVPGTGWYGAYPSFHGYWAPSWAMVNSPGYVVNDKRVTVETLVYSIGEEKLLWAGRTQTENPGSVNKLVDKTINTVTSELRKEQLIP